MDPGSPGRTFQKGSLTSSQEERPRVGSTVRRTDKDPWEAGDPKSGPSSQPASTLVTPIGCPNSKGRFFSFLNFAPSERFRPDPRGS